MQRILGRVAAGVGALALALGASIAVAAPASALSGTQYDGTDPAATGCATGSIVIYSADAWEGVYNTVEGTVEVRYSPSCGTNWVRVYNANASDGVTHKWIERQAQGSLPYFSETETDYGTGWAYSMQVYAPGSTCISVGGSIVTGPWVASSGTHLLC